MMAACVFQKFNYTWRHDLPLVLSDAILQ